MFQCRICQLYFLVAGYLLPDEDDEMSGLMDEESEEDEESGNYYIFTSLYEFSVLNHQLKMF